MHKFDRAIEGLTDRDRGPAAPIPLAVPLKLIGAVLKLHGPSLGDDARVLQGKAAVVGRSKGRQSGMGSRQGGEAVAAQLFDQAVLQRLVRPLAPAFGLRGMRMDRGNGQGL